MRAIIGTLILVFSFSAEARWGSAVPKIDASDMEMIGKSVSVGLDNRPIGTEVSWSNDDSGNHGSVKLLKLFTVSELPCRRIRYSVKASDDTHWQLDMDFCQDKQGLWQRQPGLIALEE